LREPRPTRLYKTLEIPKPSGEAPAGAVAQGRSRSLDDLKDDYILVEIDDRGAMKLDRQPIEPVRETLVKNLRRAREKTGRQSMLLSADFATLHRNAVLAYDAAIEIGLSIAIAKPQSLQGPAPTLRATPAAAPRPVPNSSAAPAAPSELSSCQGCLVFKHCSRWTGRGFCRPLAAAPSRTSTA